MDDRHPQQIKIAWMMPNYGPIFSPVYTSHLSAAAYASRSVTVSYLGKLASIGTSDRMTIDTAETELVEDFLRDPDNTHLFLTESDMLLPHDALVKLLALDKPIAGGLYVLRGDGATTNLFQQSLTVVGNKYLFVPVSKFPLDRPFQVDHVCFGCVLIRREVFETLERPYFHIDMKHHGSDMYFYRHCKEKGIEVWCDPTVWCDQIDYCIVGKETYMKHREADPKMIGHGYMLEDV